LRYSFPLAFMANTFAVTVLLIALGLTGNQSMAAEVGVVQAATLALLYAFSANARSLILNKSSGVSAYAVMVGRLLLLVPLAAASYWLSAQVAGVGQALAVILIIRRCIEWLGEVHLSEMERLAQYDVAKHYFGLQSVLLILLLIWLIGGFGFPLLGLFIWAVLPLMFSLGFIWKLLATASSPLSGVVGKMLPNLGSTAIIGVTVYVFRLLILLVAGKENAGDLYTAFAIGGVTGSVFANALGASIALHEQSSGKRYLPSFLRYALNSSLLFGAVIFIGAISRISILASTGKSYFFWETTGLSMIGGVIMVYAQQVRFRLLQHDSEHDVFGPDVLMNILIFALVPFAFYLFGLESMSALYLVSSLMAYLFYTSAKKEKQEIMGKQVYSLRVEQFLRNTIGVLLLLPLFFQLSHGIFNETSVAYDSGGILRDLPIPVSVIACYGGILLLGTYRRAFVSFGYIFLTCVLMMMSSIINTQNLPIQQQAKFILLIQYVLPMFALVLGQVFEPVKISYSDDSYSKPFFWVLMIVVPVQMVFTWQSGLGYLSPRLGVFSVYQTLQYVPVIFVSAYILALFGLWHSSRYRIGLWILSLCMGVYVAASLSILAGVLFFVGVTTFAVLRLRNNKEKLPLVLLLLAFVLSYTYFQYEKNMVRFKFGYLAGAVAKKMDVPPAIPIPLAPPADAVVQTLPSRPSAASKLPPNLTERFKYWNYYSKGITSSVESLLLGLSSPPDRSRYPSAHNYYLDFIYNFGFLALLPTLLLIGMTTLKIFKRRSELLASPSLLSLSLVVLFLILADNSMKVSLRQPYTGLFTFFLWGILITKLSKLHSQGGHATT
jgi:hypothetical protein